MLFNESMGGYFDNHMDHTNRFCGHKSISFNADQWPLCSKGLTHSCRNESQIHYQLLTPSARSRILQLLIRPESRKCPSLWIRNVYYLWSQATTLTTTRSLRQYREEPMGGIQVKTLASRSYSGMSPAKGQRTGSLAQPALRKGARCSRTSQRATRCLLRWRHAINSRRRIKYRVCTFIVIPLWYKNSKMEVRGAFKF